MKNQRSISKTDPHMVALHGSYDYIKVVIQDLISIVKEQDKLAQEIMSLNPDCCYIDEGNIRNLQEIAKKIIWR